MDITIKTYAELRLKPREGGGEGLQRLLGNRWAVKTEGAAEVLVQSLLLEGKSAQS